MNTGPAIRQVDVMTIPSPLSIAEPWNRIARGYAAEVDWMLAPFSRHAIELSMVTPTASVIDVAAGPGTLALQVARRVRYVAAIDFAASMVDALRIRAREQRVNNLRAVQADGQALPFREAAFHAGFSMFGWMFFPDRAKGLAELRRVLAPGAPLVVSSWAPLASSPLMTAVFGALRAADPAMPPARYDSDSLENPKRLAYELREAGFVNVAVHEHTISVPYESPHELWTRMVRMSAPVAALRERVGEVEWPKRHELAMDYLRSELGEGRGSLPLTAWLGCSVR